jgi:ribosomal protein S18 acetylase RimI-like enzyme
MLLFCSCSVFVDFSERSHLCGILVLMGFGLQGLSADRERGYLSNVCVAPLMRQRGIGMALLQQAQNMSQLWGVTNLYVHAVATNEAAVKLYSKGGFTVVATSEAPVKLSSTGSFTLEKEAVITIARRQTRPSRLLLRKFI